MQSTTATSPTPAMTDAAVQDGLTTGLVLAIAIVAIVLLTVLVGAAMSFRRRSRPAPPHPDRPFANP
jgi:heme/copper-type cytochrome/quinol oxidase subunit 2